MIDIGLPYIGRKNKNIYIGRIWESDIGRIIKSWHRSKKYIWTMSELRKADIGRIIKSCHRSNKYVWKKTLISQSIHLKLTSMYRPVDRRFSPNLFIRPMTVFSYSTDVSFSWFARCPQIFFRPMSAFNYSTDIRLSNSTDVYIIIFSTDVR